MSETPRIMVVDDDPASAHMLELAFRETRAEVVVATSPFGVLNSVRTHRPALVILDVMMPGLDGPTVVKLLRSDAELSGTRVVLWSALDAGELARRGQDCGADGVILKIAGPRAAVDQVCHWLREWDSLELR